MESVSSVRTMLGIVHDILAAVETASQNKSRCKKVAKRVRCIKDILEAAAAVQDDGTTSSTAAMDRLEEALSSALQVVRQCQRSSFLGSVIVVVAGGRSMAESLDEVERDIDRCILDLTLANSLRLETLLIRRQHNDDMAATDNSIEDNISQKDDESNRKNKGKSVVPDKMMDDPENNTTTTAAIGVPVYTMTSAVVHEMVPPPPSYVYYCSCGSYHSYDYWQNHSGRDDGDAGESSNVALYHTQYSSYHPSMFSDDDPNSCSIM